MEDTEHTPPLDIEQVSQVSEEAKALSQQGVLTTGQGSLNVRKPEHYMIVNENRDYMLEFADGTAIATPAGNSIRVPGASTVNFDANVRENRIRLIERPTLGEDHARMQAIWGWRQENDRMAAKFFEIRDLIQRLYDWFRADRNKRNKSVLMSQILAENCESTLLRLFGKDALYFLQLVFLDLSVL